MPSWETKSKLQTSRNASCEPTVMMAAIIPSKVAATVVIFAMLVPTYALPIDRMHHQLAAVDEVSPSALDGAANKVRQGA